MKTTNLNAIANSISYGTYIELVGKLVETNATTGPDQSEVLVNFTKLNYKRMTRLNKTVHVSDQLIETVSSLPFNMKWVVVAEAWCGDAAQNIPYIALLAKACANVEIRIVLRDENLDFMDNHLTKGARSIPKAVIFKADDLKEIASWGPRPAIIQEQVMAFKKDAPIDLSYEKFAESMHGWYAKDKNKSLETELFTIFHSIKETTPV
ncbi:thioredoxin family protein [Cryomorpha ignava]|uniref:Thioredoxin family protein n=1 Tax=Cryomorpha ignava TaxID=101383 RepID=A0A7K3WMA7_9FLAO|nr:thioredoxin family protein [Cryomorpha ignava]NEN22658.1 thioredoxin family protein [Cryomorpha ignava]